MLLRIVEAAPRLGGSIVSSRALPASLVTGPPSFSVIPAKRSGVFIAALVPVRVTARAAVVHVALSVRVAAEVAIAVADLVPPFLPLWNVEDKK